MSFSNHDKVVEFLKIAAANKLEWAGGGYALDWHRDKADIVYITVDCGQMKYGDDMEYGKVHHPNILRFSTLQFENQETDVEIIAFENLISTFED